MTTKQFCGCDDAAGTLCKGHERQPLLLGGEQVQRAKRVPLTVDEPPHCTAELESARYHCEDDAGVWVAVAVVALALVVGFALGLWAA